MRPETKQEIIKRVNLLWSAVAPAWGREKLDHDEGVKLFNEWYGEGAKIPYRVLCRFEAAQALLSKLQPKIVELLTLNLGEQLAKVDSNEKLAIFLDGEPEPDPTMLASLLSLCDESLPEVRRLAISNAKLLPANEGGRPRVIPLEQYPAIRDEIRSLRGPSVNLKDIFLRLSQKYEVSPSKIKEIWQDGVGKEH